MAKHSGKKSPFPTPPPGQDYCSHCKRLLLIEAFYPVYNKSHRKRGHSYICKDCARQSARDAAKKRTALGKKTKEMENGPTHGTDTTAALPPTD